MESFERVPRLDPGRAIDVVADVTGVQLTVDGRARSGEVGAAYVRWPDGHRSVLTMGVASVAPLLDLARRADVPAPRYELAVSDGDLTYVVQTVLPGAPPETVDARLVEQMIAANDRLAGLLHDRPDLAAPSLYLRTSGPGFCLHEPLARYDRRTVDVLAWVRDVGTDCDLADGDDLVHLDFHPGNTLVSAGAITGVVDWDGATRGDGRIDLVTLRFDVALRAPDLIPWFDELLDDRVPLRERRAYWAHMSLRQVDWSIRHHTSAAVDFWLEVVGQGRARLGDT